ncbi:MAG: hypothetical protein KDD47_25445 [Acidobacteria bacterium]|nr:hypothetical protein [Acidobacteriota bacterium]
MRVQALTSSLTKTSVLILALNASQLSSAQTPDFVGAEASVGHETEQVFGLHGISNGRGAGSAGLVGECTASSGDAPGVVGRVTSSDGIAGLFQAPPGAKVLRGLSSGSEVFSVSHDGVVTATAFIADGAALSYTDLECGHCVDGSEIGDQTVSSQSLEAGAIRSAEMANRAVGTAQIAPGEVRTRNLGNGAVGAEQIELDAIWPDSFAPGALLAENFADGIFHRDEIADGAVTRAKINGVERPVYLLAGGCRAQPRLNTQPQCTSRACESDNAFFWDCAGTVCQSSGLPLLCNNSFVGYVLSPEIEE